MTTAPSRGRKGYTTLEVLVSVAILLVLSGIVVPAVQRVRETANQARCRSNLRQLALAAHGYDAAHGVLPPGYLGPLADSPKPLPAEKTGPWVGCLYLLLPYIEQDGLYSRFEDTRLTLPAGPPPQAGARLRPRLDIQQEAWWVNPANLRPDTGGAHVRQFECPSDDLYAPVDRVFPGYYVGGPFGQYTRLVEPSPNFDTRVLGRTNYAGVAGLQGAALDESFVQGYDGRYDGALSSRSRISLQQIGAHDGTSNTLLFGETLGGSATGVVASPQNTTARGTALSWVGVGCLSTGWGVLDPRRGGQSSTMDNAGTVDTGTYAGLYGYSFSSRHPRGAYFAFADGSIRLVQFEKPLIYVPIAGSPNHFQRPPLPNNTPWGLLQQLAGWRDGDRQDCSPILD
jgi:prepilin-type processing-associated H-X9-DG protein